MIEVAIDATGRQAAKPNPGGQADFAADWTHRFVGLEGGWYAGKTFIGARKLLTLHIHNAFDAAGEPTRVKSAQISPTFGATKDIAIPALEDAAEEFGVSFDFRTTSKEGDMIMLFVGSSRCLAPILLRTAEKAERITGWTVGTIWGDEVAQWPDRPKDPRRDPWTQMMGRLRAHQARLLQGMFTYTNEGDHTRVYREFHKGDGDFKLYTASTYENPHAVEFADTVKISGALRGQYIHGHAASLRGGKVYDQYEPETHVGDVELVDHLPLQVALDFNIRPGMHALIGQYDEAADLFTVAHEIHDARMDVRRCGEALVRLISSLGGWLWPGELEVFGDATGQSASAHTVLSCYAIFREALTRGDIPHRLRVPAHNPPILDRVNAFNLALRDMAGESHWICNERCERVRADLQAIAWGTNGQIDDSDQDLTHASSAEGYRIEFLRPARVTATTRGRGGIATVPAYNG